MCDISSKESVVPPGAFSLDNCGPRTRRLTTDVKDDAYAWRTARLPRAFGVDDPQGGGGNIARPGGGYTPGAGTGRPGRGRVQAGAKVSPRIGQARHFA